MQVPPGTVPVIEGIVRQGYLPVIAHPERYANLAAPMNSPDTWREAGALLQVNHGSLVGQYGPRARDNALRILASGWADVLSSDFHAREHLILHVSPVWELFDRAGAADVFHQLVVDNPGRMLRDEEVASVSPVELDRGLWGRLKGLIKKA